MVHTALGTTFLKSGQVREAADELQKGFDIDERLRNRRGLTIVTPRLVEALRRLGRNDEAKDVCERALAIAPRERKLQRLRDERAPKRRTWTTTGRVTRILHHARGHHYGFLAPDDGRDDVYFDERFLDAETFSRLEKGTRVEVEAEQSPQGPRAVRLRVLSAEV